MNAPSAIRVGEAGLPALVFLHGVGGDGGTFSAQLDAFADTHTCLAWHMPGYANSATIDPYDWDGLAHALIALLDAHHLDSATLVGHSIGGMVAQHAVALAPERVESLVLSATSPAFGNRDGDFQQQFLNARLGPLDAGETLASLAPGIVDNLLGQNPVTTARDAAIAAMAAVPEASYRAAMTAITVFDARASLPRIACPTLLIAGSDDTNAPAAMMARMADKIPGAEYACLDGLGHLSYMERPDLFNTTLRTFLDARTGMTPP